MNSENSKVDPHRPLSNLTFKIDLRKKTHLLPYQILVFTVHEKTLKNRIKAIDLKFLLQHGMKNLNYLMNHVFYKIFKMIFNIC